MNLLVCNKQLHLHNKFPQFSLGNYTEENPSKKCKEAHNKMTLQEGKYFAANILLWTLKL